MSWRSLLQACRHACSGHLRVEGLDSLFVLVSGLCFQSCCHLSPILVLTLHADVVVLSRLIVMAHCDPVQSHRYHCLAGGFADWFACRLQSCWLTLHCSYAGGAFDPLGLASAGDSKAFRLKTAEIKHGRLAMIAFLGTSKLWLLYCVLPVLHSKCVDLMDSLQPL